MDDKIESSFFAGFFSGLIVTIMVSLSVFIMARSSALDSCRQSTGAAECVKEWRAVE